MHSFKKKAFLVLVFCCCCFVCFCWGLIEPKVSYMLDKYSTIELHPQPLKLHTEGIEKCKHLILILYYTISFLKILYILDTDAKLIFEYLLPSQSEN